MKNCKYCGAMLPDDARACSNCGRPTGYVPVKAPEEKKTAPEAVDSGSDASKAGEDSSWNTGSFENAERKEKSGTWSRPRVFPLSTCGSMAKGGGGLTGRTLRTPCSLRPRGKSACQDLQMC